MHNIGVFPKLFINASIFLFFSLLLVFPKGYNYGSTALLILSVLFLCYLLYKRVSISTIVKQNKAIFVVTTFYFLVSLFFIFFHGEKINLIDNPLRAFLFLSVIIFVVYNSVKFDFLIYSIPVGAFISGVIALYQYYILNLESAFYSQMKIQSGDMAMSLGLFSFVIAFHLLDINKTKLAVLVIISGIFGILASLLSFARGGWIAFPLVLIFLFALYNSIFSKKTFAITLITILLSFSLLSLNDKVTERVVVIQKQLLAYVGGYKISKVDSVGERLDMWYAGVKALQEHPIFGWGTRGLDVYKKSLVEKGEINSASIGYSHLHNQFIDELAKKGIVGGIAILSIFIVPLYLFYRKAVGQLNKRIKFISILGIVHVLSMIIYCMSQSFLAHNSGNIFYFFVLFLFYAFMVNESAITPE